MPVVRPDYFENGVYHIYNRGVAKLPIFLSKDDYFDFQDILRYLLVGFPTRKDPILPTDKPLLPVTYKADPISNGLFKPLLDLLAYCLMPNHFHLLVQVKLPIGEIKQTDGRIGSFYAISEFIRRLCITYSHKFNRRNKRDGAVFQGKYKIKHVPSDKDVLQVIRYIHLNPVVANLAIKPEQWSFSDYHTYITPDNLARTTVTNMQLVLSLFNNNPDQYRDFVGAEISEQEGKIIGKYIVDQDLEQT